VELEIGIIVVEMVTETGNVHKEAITEEDKDKVLQSVLIIEIKETTEDNARRKDRDKVPATTATNARRRVRDKVKVPVTIATSVRHKVKVLATIAINVRHKGRDRVLAITGDRAHKIKIMQPVP
jgi:hypothetical protein